MSLLVHDESEMLELGDRLARSCHNAIVVYLRGPLGAGKTTLVRGFMHGISYTGVVKSPTYTLIEPYEVGEMRLYHLDLYRIETAQELAYLGLRELHDGKTIMLVEWPERGAGFLPPADLILEIEYAAEGRRLSLIAPTPAGEAVAKVLASADFSPS
jgi:tRNA threonylcarbamoyladenosine biosynthesis protein TsaE